MLTMFDFVLQATLICLCGAVGGAGMALSIITVFGRRPVSKTVIPDHEKFQAKADSDWQPMPVDEASRLSA